MKLVPLGYTTVTWGALDTFVSGAVGISAINYCDSHKISPGSLYSQIVAIELLCGRRISRLGEADISLNHISLTFGIECDPDDLTMLVDLPGFKTTSHNKVGRYEMAFVFITMTLQEWKSCIIRYCRANGDRYVRELFNDFYDLFNAANLGELFEGYEHNKRDDGTFALEKD